MQVARRPLRCAVAGGGNHASVYLVQDTVGSDACRTETLRAVGGTTGLPHRDIATEQRTM